MRIARTAGLGVATVRELDRLTIERFGVPGAILMENAGRGAARMVQECMLEGGFEVAWCLAGPGNNGGDACVVARHLHEAEIPVHLSFLADPEDARAPDALLHGRAARLCGVPWSDDRSVAAGARLGRLPEGTLIVDGLLGTGLTRAPRGAIGEWIAALAGRPAFALDVPSGLMADDGTIPGAVLPARVTATFGALKRGMVAGSAARLCGQVRILDIGWPRAAIRWLEGGGAADTRPR